MEMKFNYEVLKNGRRRKIQPTTFRQLKKPRVEEQEKHFPYFALDFFREVPTRVHDHRIVDMLNFLNHSGFSLECTRDYKRKQYTIRDGKKSWHLNSNTEALNLLWPTYEFVAHEFLYKWKIERSRDRERRATKNGLASVKQSARGEAEQRSG